MKENRKTLIITCCLILVPVLLGLVYYDQLPQQMPIHWNAAGEVDGYASKPFAVFGMPALLLGLQVLMFAVILSDPKKQNQSGVMRNIGFWGIPVISLVMFPMTIFTAQGYDLPIDRIAILLVGVMLIIVGNYMPKTKQNYTIGIKLPWTLHDTENWNKTHRLAGFLWVIGGVVFIATGLIPAMPEIAIFITVALIIGIPTGYSYWLYQKKRKA